MKIRRGFVSNSSSASYIVTIQGPYEKEDELLRDIYGTCDTAMEELEEAYFERQAEYDREMLQVTNIQANSIFRYIDRTERRRRLFTTGTEEIPSLLEGNAVVERTKLFLGYEGIVLTQDSVTSKFILTAFTSMHNSFLSVNRLLSTIYFEFLTHMDGATFKMKSDD